MGEVVYFMCMLMSATCAFALIRGYRQTPSYLLLWSGACFVGLAINCAILFIDLVLIPDVDFGGLLLRNIALAAAGGTLLFGLIWEVS